MAADGQQARSRRKPIVTGVPIGSPESRPESSVPAAKPTPASLGVDLGALDWQRSGNGPGALEVAFVAGSRDPRSEKAASRPGSDDEADWVLLRVAGDPDGRVLVYDRNEWTCFLDGAGRGEFDWPEALTRVPVA